MSSFMSKSRNLYTFLLTIIIESNLISHFLQSLMVGMFKPEWVMVASYSIVCGS